MRAPFTLLLRVAELPQRRRGSVPLWEKRYEWIRRLAPGKSFLDLGGMWGVHGRVAFLAEEAGAEQVVLFDEMDPTDEFNAEHQARKSRVRHVQGDLHDEAAIADLGVFDIVWCTGVIYHSPNPYQQIDHLRRLTGEGLVLGTHVLPDVPLMPNLCLFLPGLPKSMRAAFASRMHGKAGMLWGLTTDFDYSPGGGYANCWWMISHSALDSMLEVAAFERRETHSDSPYWIDLIATPVARPSVLPPSNLAREKGQSRHAASEKQGSNEANR